MAEQTAVVMQQNLDRWVQVEGQLATAKLVTAELKVSLGCGSTVVNVGARAAKQAVPDVARRLRVGPGCYGKVCTLNRHCRELYM